jgi:hypothetical protein
VLITFTETGLKFLQDSYQIKREIDEQYAAILGQEDFATLHRLLTRLTTTVNEETIE